MKFSLAKIRPPKPDFYHTYLDGMQFWRRTCWESCRDFFLESIRCKKNKTFFLTNFKGLKAGIKAIKAVENKLKLKESHRFKIYRTIEKRIYYVDMGKFWGGNSVRISVFSALLKGKGKYINSSKCKEFLSYFEKGYTVPSSKYLKSRGFVDNASNVGESWVYRYCGEYIKTADKVEELLKTP